MATNDLMQGNVKERIAVQEYLQSSDFKSFRDEVTEK